MNIFKILTSPLSTFFFFLFQLSNCKFLSANKYLLTYFRDGIMTGELSVVTGRMTGQWNETNTIDLAIKL